jgi:hypothetical protein
MPLRPSSVPIPKRPEWDWRCDGCNKGVWSPSSGYLFVLTYYSISTTIHASIVEIATIMIYALTATKLFGIVMIEQVLLNEIFEC